ncbi:unnamed protein product [Didymodactylos carnosus]|uniref:TIR domain-containing protein n=1 Tax=Didymodactylos carnosus TaxID=1234261 RepID=A0A813UJP6_9BILA|nr:unnamed protein product [Didymodactylos carnosus]CAF0999251.1 unnamed protein product [Didymodactylos carnosus]CAF3617141.1 unnamed protein product [Didymodactylos carnosus]CAF3768738.1 unnamed protein product [Didymodactylos carnosus]
MPSIYLKDSKHLNDGSELSKPTFTRQTSASDSLVHVVQMKRLAKIPLLFLAKRRKMRKISMDIEHTDETYTDENAGYIAATQSPEYQNEPKTFAEYTQQLEDTLDMLSGMNREQYESQKVLKQLKFLENLIHQPREWVSGAKLKLSEKKFPAMAMTLMRAYKEKGILVRRIVFVHSILLYNCMANFTDGEFDKEGLIRKQAAEAGFIEFALEILSDQSYTLTILYNIANMPELKIQFRECNAVITIVEYTKLKSDTVSIAFEETPENKEYVSTLNELQDIISAIRVTSCLILPLIMNEDEDNLLAQANEVLPLLTSLIHMYKKTDQRFYGFSFVELVDGLSKIMVKGRTHKYIDKSLVNFLLDIMDNSKADESLLECVSSAILNASFDEKVQLLLNSDHTVDIITNTRDSAQSLLVQKNCEAILWTLNKTPHRRMSSIQNRGFQGHIMISYNRSCTAMCIKMRDRLKALHYNVWMDIDNINGGVLESMAEAVEKSSVVLICMNENYKQSYYCRLEAEYATELRKPCIPCLMQPRFRPYGWLGIIKGAKIHVSYLFEISPRHIKVDFATYPFEEAFAILIREIETIRQDLIPPIVPNTLENKITEAFKDSSSKNHQKIVNNATPDKNDVIEWDVSTVRRWLAQIGLTNMERALSGINGRLLWRLSQMKSTAPESYYTIIDKYFDRVWFAQMSDILVFDNALEELFHH